MEKDLRNTEVILGEDAPMNEDEEDWFAEGERADSEIVELNRRLGFGGMERGCQPRWLNKKTAGLFVGFLAVGASGLEKAKEKYEHFFDKESESQTVVQEKAPEIELPQIERMQKAFTDAAERLRTNNLFEGEITAEQRELIAQELENYPVKRVLQEIADLSGVSLEDVAKRNSVSFVTAVSGDQTYEFVAYLDKTGEKVETGLQEYARGCAGMNVQGEAIFLNMTQVYDEDPELFREKINDVLTHELIHGFKQESFMPDERTRMFYEGVVEDFSNTIDIRVWPDMSPDPFPGYNSGWTAFSQLTRGLMDSTDYWQNLVLDQRVLIEETIDANYGLGAFRKALLRGQENNFDGSVSYGPASAINGLLSMMEDETPGSSKERLAKVNRERRTGKLYQWENENWKGLFVVSTETQTGFSGGYIEEQGTDKPRTIFLSGNLYLDRGTFYIPKKGSSYAEFYERLADYNGELSLDEAPADEVQDAINKMMMEHAEELDMYRERDV